MEKKRKISQSLTAYQCRICKKYHAEDLLVLGEEEDKTISLFELLKDYFDFIKTSKIDESTNRTILLDSRAEESTIDGSVSRLVIRPKAGKANEPFTVVEHGSSRATYFDGKTNSAVYNHHVFCYQKGDKNIIIFHRHGQSGCKTAFQNTINSFLKSDNLICHLDVMVSKGMFEGKEKFTPEKLSLLTTYYDISSDAADNIGKPKQKKVEQEVIISLSAPRAGNVMGYLYGLAQKKPSIDELKDILIRDQYPGEFDDAKLTLKFGQVRRKVSLSDFSGMIAEYDITDELEYRADGTINEQSLFSLADQYALSFLEE